MRQKHQQKALSVIAYCDIGIESVRTKLEAACRRPLPREHATGYELLLKCTFRNRNGMMDTLQFLYRTKNDQDAVRQSIFGNIARKLPPSLISADQTGPILDITNEALNVHDVSYTTKQSITGFAGELLRSSSSESHLFQLGLGIIKLTLKQSSSLDLPHLRHISQERASIIYVEISPIVQNMNFDDDVLEKRYLNIV